MNKKSKHGNEIRDDILEYLKKHQVKHVNLSIRSLADEFGKSTSVINWHLDKLVEDGKIKRDKKIARSIQVIEDDK